MTKTFKIGEYAVGGIIRAQVKYKRGRLMAIISCIDWESKEELHKTSVQADMIHTSLYISEYLNNNTSHYWAEKVKVWIDQAIQKVKQ